MKTLFYFFLHHKKRTRLIALAWTLVILFLCLIPGRDLPEVDVPLIDKWVHFLLFGAFSFLWMCSLRRSGPKQGLYIGLLTAALGYSVELLQGSGITEGRSYDAMDLVADCIGGILGLLLFFTLHRAFSRTP